MRHRELGVEGARGRRADDVGRDERLVGVLEHLGQRARLGRGLERVVDLVDGDLAA